MNESHLLVQSSKIHSTYTRAGHIHEHVNSSWSLKWVAEAQALELSWLTGYISKILGCQNSNQNSNMRNGWYTIILAKMLLTFMLRWKKILSCVRHWYSEGLFPISVNTLCSFCLFHIWEKSVFNIYHCGFILRSMCYNFAYIIKLH